MKSSKTETLGYIWPGKQSPMWYEQPEARQGIQNELRIRRGKASKRIGHLALSGIANGVILAHNTALLARGAAAKLGGEAHTAIARKGKTASPRLRERYEKRQATEATPGRIRRLGTHILRAGSVSVETVTQRSKRRKVHLEDKAAGLEKDFTQKRGKGRIVSAARAYKERQAEQKATAHREAMLKYRADHPEIEQQEQKEWQTHVRKETWKELYHQRDWIVDYFREGSASSRGGDSASSFSKAIPRLPSREGQGGFTGDYIDLAKTSLTSALAHKQEDGSVPLLGAQIQRERLATQEKEGKPMPVIGQAETEYIDGVSTMLWKLGFVEFENESDIPYGHGAFSSSVEWQTDGDVVKARLPYNAENELHTMLVPAESMTVGQMIELEMPKKEYGYGSPNYDPYMTMRAVEAVPAAVAA